MPDSYRKRIYQRTKGILWSPIEVVAAVVGLAVIFNRPVMDAIVRAWQGLPWWVGALILLGLLLYAVGRASYEEYQEVEHERDGLQERIKELQDRAITPQPGELKGLCLNLAEEIRDYMSWRDRTNPYWGAAEEREKRGSGKTEQEKRMLWAEDKVAEFRHGRETIELYHETFDERVLRLYGALEQRGWLGPQHRQRYFDNAENSAQIHATADLLEDRGNKLP